MGATTKRNIVKVAPQQEPVAQQEPTAQEPTAAVIPSFVPTTIVETPPANVDAKPDNAAPVAVPAPKNPAQVAAELWSAELRKSFLAFYAQRPIGASMTAPIDLSTDEGKAKRKELIRERVKNIMSTSPDTDMMDAAVDATTAVDATLAQYAAEYASAQGNARPINQMWLWAAHTEVSALLGTITGMLTNEGANLKTAASKPRAARAEKAADSTESKPATPKATWATKGAALNDYADSIGLNGVIFVDKSSGGYTSADGKHYHAVKLHRDGRFEEVDYDQMTHAVTPKGIFHDTWKYFNAPAVGDKPAASPKYTEQQMYYLLLRKTDGTIYVEEGVNVKNRNGIKPYADLETVYAALSI